MGSEINKLIIVIFVLAALVVGAGLITADDGSSNTSKQQKPISLPEEIQAVKPGDTLVVSKVADSIYIQFK